MILSYGWMRIFPLLMYKQSGRPCSRFDVCLYYFLSPRRAMRFLYLSMSVSLRYLRRFLL